MARSRGFVVAMALIGIVSVAACSSSSKSSGSQSSTGPKAPSSVNIGLTGGYITDWTMYMVALGNGYLDDVAKQFGTKITTNVIKTGALATTAIVGGSDQLVNSQSNAFTAPISQGRDVVALVNEWPGFGNVVIGAEKYKDSRGSNIAAYNGASWCFTAPGTSTETVLKNVAASSGLDWTKQKGLAIGSVSASLPTMQAGRCDVSAMDTTTASKAVAQGIGYLIANPNSAENQQKFFGGTQLGGTLATTQSFEQKYPALVQAIVTALIKAQIFVKANAATPTAIYAKFPSSYTSVVTSAQFLSEWPLVEPFITGTSGLITPAIVASTVALQKRSGVINTSATLPPAAFDTTLVSNAYKSLGQPVPTS